VFAWKAFIRRTITGDAFCRTGKSCNTAKPEMAAGVFERDRTSCRKKQLSKAPAMTEESEEFCS